MGEVLLLLRCSGRLLAGPHGDTRRGKDGVYHADVSLRMASDASGASEFSVAVSTANAAGSRSPTFREDLHRRLRGVQQNGC